jgi:hypothetical protein
MIRAHRIGLHDLSRIAEENAPNILLNFHRLKQVRGPELTPFMRLAMHVRNRNGRIGACHLPVGVQDLLEVARLDRVVTVYENQEQAIRAMLLPPPVSPQDGYSSSLSDSINRSTSSAVL